jgi:ABC-type transport system involved in multi-copper enzyme maturation permease subunit
VARLTVREVAQRRLAWVMLGLGLAYLTLFGIGLWAIGRELAAEGSTQVERTLAGTILLVAGLYVINFLVLVASVVVSVDTLAGEIGSGTIQTLVTKPLPRRDVVLGKYLGHALAVLVFLVLMSLGAMLLAKGLLGYAPRNVAPTLALMSLEALVVLGLSYVGGAITGTLANGLIVFMLYSLALVGSWIERIGGLLGNASAQYVGIVASLLMPSEVVWQAAAWALVPPVLGSTEFVVTPFTASNQPSPAMIAYAALYAAAALALAVRIFERRDL